MHGYEIMQNVKELSAERVAYIKFLEENGVEYVASYMWWVFFRKKSSEGPFDIYSDIESRIKHYKRINILWISHVRRIFDGHF